MITAASLRFGLVLLAATGFLDAYTFTIRGGVFANAQTGNIVLGAVDLSEGAWRAALQHLWPILAFIVGVAVATLIKRRERPQSRTLGTTEPIAIALGVVVVGAAAFVPESVPATLVIVPITLVSAMQLELFREISGLAYAPIVTTANLMRLVESSHAHLTHPDPTSRRALGIYGGIVCAFALGALAGALVTRAVGTYAAFVPACALLVLLVMMLAELRRPRGAATST